MRTFLFYNTKSTPIFLKPTTFYLFYMLLFLSSSCIFSQQFKSIGYLPYYRFDLIDQIQLEKLTHLNVAFANPDEFGTLSVNDIDIGPVVNRAHNAGLEVFISLGGGGISFSKWENLIRPQNRSEFIQKIIKYTRENNMQGIDVDLEWDNVNEDYSSFVLELNDSIDKYDLILTAALPGTYRYPEISDAALAAYDWINLMAYDLTGPWAPNNPGPHSPYSFALNSIDYWVDKGVEKERLTLGVPFYGYDFANQNNVIGLSYRDIISMNSANAQLDQVGQIYYNGLFTIERKTVLALQESSGIMIWELGQDSFDEYSLLDKIHSVINEPVIVTTNGLNIFPNPFRNEINIRLEKQQDAELILFDINGHLIKIQNIVNKDHASINSDDLPQGIYIIKIISNEFVMSRKLIKV